MFWEHELEHPSTLHVVVDDDDRYIWEWALYSLQKLSSNKYATCELFIIVALGWFLGKSGRIICRVKYNHLKWFQGSQYYNVS